jgi:hypothetical protein
MQRNIKLSTSDATKTLVRQREETALKTVGFKCIYTLTVNFLF